VLLLVVGCFMASAISQEVSGQAGDVRDLMYAGAFWPAQFFNILIWPTFIFAAFVHLFLVFPMVKEPVRRHPFLTLAAVYGFGFAATLIAIAQSLNKPLRFVFNTFGVGLIEFPLAMLVIAASSIHMHLTMHDPIARAQFRWLLFGVLVGVAGSGTLYLVGTQSGGIEKNPALFVVWYLTSLVFPFSLGVAILRYRLFDIDLIINRTLVYGTLTGLLALAYFGSVVLLQGLLRALTGQRSNLSIVASTLAIAALAQPLRRYLQATIDQHFYRRKYDAARTLAAFSIRVRDEVDLNQLSAYLLAVVEETMQPAHVSLWLRQPEGPADGHEPALPIDVA
jgi:hypothetical protein